MVRASVIAKPRKPAAVEAAVPNDAAAGCRLIQLIEAAEDMFLAKGYHNATMSDVAKAAGMSKKTVYQLIKSKTELFAALLTHHQSLFKFPDENPEWTPQQALVENLLCLAKFLLSPSQIAIVRLIMAEYTHSPDLGPLLHQRQVTRAKGILEHCLINIAKQQQFELPHPQEMAAMLFGMAIGEFHMSVLIGYRSAPTKKILEQRIHKSVDIFIAGCSLYWPSDSSAASKA